MLSFTIKSNDKQFVFGSCSLFYWDENNILRCLGDAELFTTERYLEKYYYKLSKAISYLGKRYVLHPDNKLKRLAEPYGGVDFAQGDDQTVMFTWRRGYADFKWPHK
jgi:hypothetical protein